MRKWLSAVGLGVILTAGTITFVNRWVYKSNQAEVKHSQLKSLVSGIAHDEVARGHRRQKQKWVEQYLGMELDKQYRAIQFTCQTDGFVGSLLVGIALADRRLKSFRLSSSPEEEQPTE